MATKALSELNKQQRAAVQHGSRPLLIIAGAGTGKTETLSNRVAHLIENGASPDEILLLTFTRKAAQQMANRATKIAGLALARPVEITWSGTFHAVGARLIREFAQDVGLLPNFTIKDRGDSADLMEMVRQKLCLSSSEVHFPDKDICLDIHSYRTNARLTLKQVLRTKFSTYKGQLAQFVKLFREYKRAKREQNVLDYDDLLVYWLRLLKCPQVAEQLKARFRHVLVDEYQDTNRLQAAILVVLKPTGRGVTVVGDDAQAIYSFRAATVENIREFPNLFRNVRVIDLEENYRSTNRILRACNSVINLSEQAYRKKLWSSRPDFGKPELRLVQDDAEQARYIAESVLRAKEGGIPFRSQAVLMRSSHHSQKLEIELAKRKIPFQKWGGIKFLEAAHVKDVLSVLRWLENSRDEVAALRTFKLLSGIGPSAAMRLINRLRERSGGSLRQADRPPGCDYHHWKAFVRLIKRLRQGNWKAGLRELVAWYIPIMKHDNVQLRTADLQQLCIVAAAYRSREQFLVEVTLEPPESTICAGPTREQSADDQLVLSTIHSAKGQEWDSVYILNAIDGCIPSSRARAGEEMEEERRLLYVAMSRARNYLTLMVPQRVFSWRQNTSVVDLFMRRTKFIPSSLEKRFVVRVGNVRGRRGTVASV
ncbi:ATP-dependent helicase [Bradyrhizobium zhanjiangense]|uniref:ATP-dependent helicase n=1 Tax=Bradyrhizobium zhanjiangense TaxID=1325107 RepID=UPI001008ACB5|nr:ATP-dependent helicase [Bradyrhizobium zhanjiangense]